MDTGDAHTQRPVSLDITVEELSGGAPAAVPAADPSESATSLDPPQHNILPLQESIALDGDGDGESVTPQEDSSATPSESLMDRLNDQMMESVMISDSPNNSEEDDVAPMDSFLDGGDDKSAASESKEQEKEITAEIEVSADQQEKGCSEEDADEQTEVSPEGETQTSPSGVKNEEPEPPATKGTAPKEEPVPVCTIFSQGTQPKSLAPDGFQPTLIKSPSFTMGSGGGSDEVVTPSKLSAPLVCQPSPSLSKFFSDNGQANPASDFFDSFTSPSSFISISNPNADVPPGAGLGPLAVTPEHQLSSTSSSLSTPGGPLDSGPPSLSSVFGPSTDQTTKPQPPPAPQTTVPIAVPVSTPAQAPVSTSASQTQPFSHLQDVFSGSDDPFATALSLSKVDRCHDAWLPCEETRKLLISVATQQFNPAYVETSRLTMPGLKFDNLQVGGVARL